MEKIAKLQAALKVYAQNVRTLHRHLVGDNWESDHKKFAEYYEKLDDFDDSFIEQCLSVDEKEIDMAEAIRQYDLIATDKDYNSNDAYKFIKDYFDELYNLFDKVKKEKCFTSDQVSLFEEYQNWLKLEKDFKISRRLDCDECKAKKLFSTDWE